MGEGRFNKLLAGYQPNSVYLEGVEKHGKALVTRCDKDIDVTITCIKHIYSMVLLIFSVTLVCELMFYQANQGFKGGILIGCILYDCLLVVLAGYDGGWIGVCLVGLQPVDKELYAESHPVSIKCLPEIILQIFVGPGVAMILMTVILGQSANCSK